MGGLIMGVVLGSVVAAVGLAALSLSSPLPPRAGEGVAVIEEVAAEGQPDAVEPEPEAEAAEVEAPVEAEAASEEAAPAPAEEAAAPETPVAEDAPADQAAPQGDALPATEVPLPSGSEFNRPPPEPEAALPAPDAAPAANAPQAPALAGDVTAPSFDTTPAAQPQVAAEAPAAIASLAADASAPDSPAPAPAPAQSASPTALTQPEASTAPDVRTALLPQISETPEGAETPEVGAEEPAAVPLETPVFPTIGEAPAPSTPDVPDAGAAEEAVAALSTPAFPQTSGLPQVSAVVPEVAAPEAEAEEPVAEDVAAGDLPAIEAFAAPFDATEERPLMAVVLIDEPDSRIEQSTLTRFSFPVAFAVDPLHPDAAARAAAYREAGFEVVILGTMVPEGATATDTAVAFEAIAATLPETVAVLDTPEGRIQGDRPVLDAVVEALAASGHGLVAFPRGLNAAEQSASRAGVPGATVFRFLDDEEQRATVITRYLSRAAFAAAQEGSVIVVGRTRPDTVTALFSWALGGRSEGVALAPLSAALLRASEQ